MTFPIPEDEIERVAIALSLADADERPLPNGMGFAEYYRGLAKVAILACRPIERRMGMGEALEEARNCESEIAAAYRAVLGESIGARKVAEAIERGMKEIET